MEDVATQAIEEVKITEAGNRVVEDKLSWWKIYEEEVRKVQPEEEVVKQLESIELEIKFHKGHEKMAQNKFSFDNPRTAVRTQKAMAMVAEVYIKK